MSKCSKVDIAKLVQSWCAPTRLLRKKQCGAGAIELISIAAVLIPLSLAGVQIALMYNAKGVLNNATFEAARVGAVENAKVSPMKEALARNLIPLYGGGTTSADLAKSYGNAYLDLQLAATASNLSGAGLKLDVLNPTQQAFRDFGYDDVSGNRAIPNSHLKYRERGVGEASGVNIQDANLLKIKVTYGYRLFVPLVNRMIGKSMAAIDPENAAYYLSDPPRIPIESTATVRMHSEAHLANNASFEPGSGGGAVPGSGGGIVPPAPEEVGAGGEGDEEAPANLPAGGIGDADDDEFFQSLQQSLATNNADDGVACRFLRTCGTGTPGEFCFMTPELAQSTVQSTEAGSNASGVSNPINVMNGNKFQEEIDLQQLPGPLGIQFARYYNSQSANHGPLGYGWSHSYDLSFGRINGQLVWVKQADGRSIVFREEKGRDGYFARLAKDGVLVTTETGAVWTWQSGRTIAFDEAGNVTKVTDEKGMSLRFIYDGLNRLIQVTDPQHRSLGFRYYHNNRIREVFDTTGKSVKFTYDLVGNLETVVRVGGTQRQYHYEDPRFTHHLTGITDGRGVRYATWAYDEQGRGVFGTHPDSSEQAFIEYGDGEAEVADSLGRRSTYSWKFEHGIPLLSRIDGPACSKCGSGDVEFSYDDKLRLTRVTKKDGQSVEYAYDTNSRVVNKRFFAEDNQQTGWIRTEYYPDSRHPHTVAKPSINPKGQHVAEYVYDPNGKLVLLTERGYAPDEKSGYRPISRTVSFSYDGDKITAVDGPRKDVDDVVRFEYDPSGRLVHSRYPDGSVQKVLAYDDYDRPIKTQTNNDVATEYVYDPRGDLIQAYRGARVVKYDYDADGRLVGLTNPNGVTLEITYDEAGRQTGMLDAQGNRYGRVWDSADRPAGSFIETAAGEKLLALFRLYDAEDRLRAVVSPQGSQYMVGYDEKSGRKNLELDGGKRGDFYFAADKAKQYLGVLAGDGGVTEMVGSDSKGVKAIRDAAGRVTVQMRDDFGNLLMEGSPDQGVTMYDYDEGGNVVSISDSTGHKQQYRYDAAGRVTAAIDDEGESTFSYEAGRLAVSCRAANCDYFDYDAFGELTNHRQTIDGHTFETKYVYDKKTGEVAQRVLPSGETLTYEYKANLGRMSRIGRKGWFIDNDVLSDATYQPFGMRTGYTLANGSRVAFEYDQTGRMTTLKTVQASPWRIEYDPSGNIVAIKRDSAQHSYAYDAVNRLLEAAGATKSENFTYDTLGRRQKPKDGFIKVSSAANDDDYQRDVRGNATRVGKRSFEYGINGQPLKLFVDGTLRAEYAYNSAGVRIKKTTYGGSSPKTTYYLYDVQARLTAEADEQGDVTREYVYLGQTPVAMLQNGEIFSVVTNHIGSPVEVFNPNGRSVWKADYAAFGEAEIEIKTIEFNLRFPGQYADAESGLYYNYYRYYDPQAGQYIQPDPMGIRTGLNRYAYVDSNPLKYTDPLGLFKVQFRLPLSKGVYKDWGEAIHESIVWEAFEEFNRTHEKNGRAAFSNHTIGLFVYENVKTDLIVDDSHQFLFTNHFDQPSPDKGKIELDAKTGDWKATWIEDTMKAVRQRRLDYKTPLGPTDFCAQSTTEKPDVRQEVWEPDIRHILHSFGRNTHTLADFYAHTNWVDDPDSKSSTLYPDYLAGKAIHIAGLGKQEIWDEETFTGIFSGSAEGCDTYDCVRNAFLEDLIPTGGNGGEYMYNLENGTADVNTHAFWAKDEPSKEGFEKARELAVAHVLKEIEQLWADASNNEQLLDIFATTKDEKDANRVNYFLGEFCEFCRSNYPPGDRPPGYVQAIK